MDDPEIQSTAEANPETALTIANTSQAPEDDFDITKEILYVRLKGGSSILPRDKVVPDSKFDTDKSRVSQKVPS